MNKILALLALAVLSFQLASAMTINSVSVDNISPGTEGVIRIEVENTLNELAKDINLNLNFQGLPFIPVGSSSGGVDELKEDDEENFAFRIRASNDVAPGDYQIPYVLTFRINSGPQTREGSIGISVNAQPELSYSADIENPIVGRQSKINLKIVNKGLADARFVSVNLNPSGFTLLSEKEVYIGTVDSDDFETATFEVIFTSEKPKLTATVEYTDFDNSKKLDEVNLPTKVYTQEKAIELGIIQRNNWPIYIGVIVALVILWLIWR
ncbi:MAG: hypothetical protein AABY02_02500, partial [Nanoarchaeota archaeon]